MTAVAPSVFRRRRGAAPLFVPVFALVLLTLLGAHAVNLAIVYLLPPPPPEILRVSEVAAALRAPGRSLATQNGARLQSQVFGELPAPRNLRPTRTRELLQSELADQSTKS